MFVDQLRMQSHMLSTELYFVVWKYAEYVILVGSPVVAQLVCLFAEV